MSLRDQPAFVNLVDIVERHVGQRIAAQQTGADSPSVEQNALAFEVATLQRMMARLGQIGTEQQLIDFYFECKSLLSSVIEFDSTRGENAAGEFLFPRVLAAVENLGIDPKPMRPSTSPAPKR